MDITTTLLLLLFLKFVLIGCTSKRDSDKLSECESGWIFFHGTCYLDSSLSAPQEKAREKSFFDSQRECHLRNSTLISMYSGSEEEFLQYLLDYRVIQKDNLQKYWISNENEGQTIGKELMENCSSLSINSKSLKKFEISFENCLKKYNYICNKKNEGSSTDQLQNCESCNKRKRRSIDTNLSKNMKLVHYHPSWNSPFRTSYKAPFWDDFSKTDPLPRYFYHKPLDDMTFLNTRRRLQSELPKWKPSPLLPLLQRTTKPPSSMMDYQSDEQELDHFPLQISKNPLPVRILKILNGEFPEDDYDNQFNESVECRNHDFEMNDTCYHVIIFETPESALQHCTEKYEGILEEIIINSPSANKRRKEAESGETLRKRLKVFHYELMNPEKGYSPPKPPEQLYFCKYDKKTKAEYARKRPASCPDSWNYNNEVCYKLFTQNKTFSEAKSFCSKENATLLNYINLSNKTQSDFMLDALKDHVEKPNKFWIGGDTCYTLSILVLKDSQRTVKRLVNACTEKFYFICEKREEFDFGEAFRKLRKYKLSLRQIISGKEALFYPTTRGVPFEGLCQEEYPDNWLRFGDYCYQFFTFTRKRPVSWPESQHICEEKNAFLASIHTKEENTWIHSKIKAFQDNFLWIGGKYDGKSKFLWDDGTSFDYIHWAPGEPNNLNEMEECVSIRTHDETGEWNDDHCYEKAGYICKKLHSEVITSVKPLNGTTTTTTTLPTMAKVETILAKNNKTTVTTSTTTTTTTTPKSTTTLKPTTSKRIKTTMIKTTMMPTTTKTTTKTTTTTTTTETTTTTSPSKTTTTATTTTTTIPITRMKTPQLPITSTLKSSEKGHFYKSVIIFPSATPTPKATKGLEGGCPETWTRMENKCVKFHDIYSMNYFEARDFCFSLDKRGKASLVSIHSEKQLALLFALMTSYKDTWIGLRYNSIVKRDFAWEDMSEVDYVHWAQDEPTVSSYAMQDLWANFRGCVQIIIIGEELGYWRDIDCSRQVGAFVCQRPLDPKYEKTVVPFPKKCSAPYDKYYSFGDNCYRYIDTPLEWKEAETVCNKEGAHLVTVRNRKEMSYLWNQFSNMNSSEFWIGLKGRLFARSYSKWNSGWPLTYTNWDIVRYLFRPCISMSSSSGKWKTQNCYYKFPFVCEYSKRKFPNTTANSKHCPYSGNWIDFPGDYCYSLDTSKLLSWPEASHHCIKNKGYLVSINSEEEQNNVQLIVDGAEKSVWIGATRLHDFAFGWSDSSKFEFKKWYTGEPLSHLFECVEMMNIGGYWAASICSRPKPFICKILKTEVDIYYDSEKNQRVLTNNSFYLTENAQKEPLEENQSGRIGGVAIGGILMFILFIIGFGFVVGFFLIKKRQVQNTQPTTFYGFDNVIYNADTITVAGQQIICAPEERECILDEDEDVEEPKLLLTKSKSSENISSSKD